MSFLRESHLKAHSRAKHLQDKRYICTFAIPEGEEGHLGNFGFKRVAGQGGELVDGGRECGAKFTTNQHLKRHLKSHQKALPHVVGFSFSTRGVEAFLKKTAIAYHQNLAFLLGFQPYAIAVFFKNASTPRVGFADGNWTDKCCIVCGLSPL